MGVAYEEQGLSWRPGTTNPTPAVVEARERLNGLFFADGIAVLLIDAFSVGITVGS
jgi:hypothetical protein